MVCFSGHQQNRTVQLKQENFMETDDHQVSSDLLANGFPDMPAKVLSLNDLRNVNVILHFSSNIFNSPVTSKLKKQIKNPYFDNFTIFPFVTFPFPPKLGNNSQRLKEKIKCFLDIKFKSKHSDISEKFPICKNRSENVNLFMLPTITLNNPLMISTALWARYSKEIVRIHTFSRYPINSAKSALPLAADGFVYVGNGSTGDDEVECYSCRKRKKNWLPADDVHEVHRSLDPGCPMITGVNCSNEPLMSSMAALYNTSSENEVSAGENVSTHHGTFQEEVVVRAQAEVFNDRHENEGQPSILNSSTILDDLDGEGDSNHLLMQLSLGPTALCYGNPDHHNGILESAYTASTNPEEVISNISAGNAILPQSNSSINEGRTGNLSNQELGIITERPKRPEYALKSKRLETYANSWPKDHHLKPVDLTEAGFYYAGYGDCARCFYCGGGLRNWEDDDHEWVEHARWFPKCAYVRQQHGQVFVDVVQELHRTNDKISYQMVLDAMGGSFTMEADNQDLLLKKDPAVLSLIELGYSERDVLDAALTVKDGMNFISAESLLEKLTSGEKQTKTNKPVPTTSPGDLEKRTRHLKERNNQLRQQTVCKICLDKVVAVVFLPCGHLVSCVECASAMGNCPYCREPVQGIVRAFMV